MKIDVLAKSRAAVLPIALTFLAWPSAYAQFTFVNPTGSITTVADTAGGTLLVPYFEVDMKSPTGKNTIFTVNNTGATSFVYNAGVFQGTNVSGPTAVLAHVVIWSELGVPVFNFNIYLTGLDVERVNMRSLLTGTLPQTASAGQDPTDTISPKGSFSQDINFASCNTGSGYTPPITSWGPLPAKMTAPQVDNALKSLTGSPAPGQGLQCASVNHGDNIARGYVTIDTVNNCTSRFPGDVGYIGAGGTGDMTNQTQLTGEVYYVDQDHSVARSENLVHVHADSVNPLTTTAGNYTFYGRYDGFNATDNRQPLATSFAARFLSGSFAAPAVATGNPFLGPQAGDAGTTSLVVWRDPKVNQGYFACGLTPAWYPLGQEGIVAFDESEHPQLITGVVFPAATQVVQIGGSALPVSYLSGWLYLDLNTTVAGVTFPTPDPAASQAWVQVIEQSSNHFYNTMHRATQLDSATQASHYVP
jgi:hypothetical protein